MKLHIYKNTPFGLERVNENALTIEEAKAVIRANPTLTMRDAESQSYEALIVPLVNEDIAKGDNTQPPTDKELAIAKNFKIGLDIALVLCIITFLIEILS